MNENWLKVYSEFNIDLTKHEFIVVGEKDGKTFRYHFEVKDLSYLTLNIILDNINTAIEEYIKI